MYIIWLHIGSWKNKSVSCSIMFDSLQPWTVAPQPPLSVELSKQEYWSGLPFPSPGDLPNPGMNPGLPHYRRILDLLSHQGSPKILEWVAFLFSRGSSQPRDEPRSPALRAGSLPAEPPERDTRRRIQIWHKNIQIMKGENENKFHFSKINKRQEKNS